MQTSLLQTKLFIPPTRPDLVPRRRLLDRLNEGLPKQSASLSEGLFARKLTLVSAPAGFGKTTLVSDWLRHIDLSTAWLSLDEGDNDLTRFLNYFIAALQYIDTEIGQSLQGTLQSPPTATGRGRYDSLDQ